MGNSARHVEEIGVEEEVAVRFASEKSEKCQLYLREKEKATRTLRREDLDTEDRMLHPVKSAIQHYEYQLCDCFPSLVYPACLGEGIRQVCDRIRVAVSLHLDASGSCAKVVCLTLLKCSTTLNQSMHITTVTALSALRIAVIGNSEQSYTTHDVAL